MDMKDEGSLAPRHPPRREAIVDNVSSNNRVFKDNSNERIRLITDKATGVEIGKIIAPEDLEEETS
jgi:hypothetical protein